MSKPSKVSNDEFVNLIRTRMFEIRTELAKVKKPEERARLKEALLNNCAWLISLGYVVDKSELGEV